MPIVSSHAGDLQAISYWVQDMQGLHSSCRAYMATAVIQWSVPEASDMQLGQDTRNKASAL